ncbi:MAG: DUF115 domain-containing protein [Planctomycetaceae bacterium]|nr:MAG: DUF115 domain-containing protein [Planctomycetaceae bacterium]
MSMISEAYREQNRLLHEERDDYGRSGAMWAPYVSHLINDEHYKTVLDYGCGKGTLALAIAEMSPMRQYQIREYDPAIADKAAPPEPADLVVCTDVLEHIEPEHLESVIADLRRLSKKRLFFNIATRPAIKTLPDGRNAHLIIEEPDWWRAKIASHFHILTWITRQGLVYGEATPKSQPMLNTVAKAAKRRDLTPEWSQRFIETKALINRYSDLFSKVETIRMWEACEDEPADIQVACNIIEYMPDPDAALFEITKLARKGVVITIQLDEVRNEKWWRRLIEQRFQIAHWAVEEGHIIMVGGPTIKVGGTVFVGVVDSDIRWEYVEAAVKRIKRRIHIEPAHGHRAILACYGPSLNDTIGVLRSEIDDCWKDGKRPAVVSMSASHDFLLDYDIIPNYHVECDPRPHKAKHIKEANPFVKYLIASCVHPVVFDKLGPKAHIELWHASTNEHTARLVDELREKPEHIISGGGSVGLKAIPLFYAMGYRKFSIYGMDCSFADDGATQHAGAHAGKRQDVVWVPVGDRVFASSRVLCNYATQFFEYMQKGLDVEVHLYGDGMLQHMCRLHAGGDNA